MIQLCLIHDAVSTAKAHSFFNNVFLSFGGGFIVSIVLFKGLVAHFDSSRIFVERGYFLMLWILVSSVSSVVELLMLYTRRQS